MNHIDERALALLDSGDLDAWTAAEAEAHLRECLSCRALSRNFEASDQWLRSLGTEPDTNELAALAAERDRISHRRKLARRSSTTS